MCEIEKIEFKSSIHKLTCNTVQQNSTPSRFHVNLGNSLHASQTQVYFVLGLRFRGLGFRVWDH